MADTLYVWQHLPDRSEPVLAGRFRRVRISAEAGRGEFRYATGYPEETGALPLDPVALPLSLGRRDATTVDLGGWFPVLRDALPDAWGRRVLARLYGDLSEMEILGRLAGDQVGALSFGTSRDDPPATARTVPGLGELAVLADTVARVEGRTTDAPVDERLLQLLVTGSGGARPKLTVEHDGTLWLAKFASAADPPEGPSVPALECATLDLAGIAGLTVPRHDLVRVRNREVLLVERFDRARIGPPGGPPAWGRHRYASARTVLWSEPEAARYSVTGSYPALSTQLARWSADPPSDRRELFRRATFNCLVSNTDDHDLNHGVVDAGGGFRLAPAFDLLPQPVTTTRQFLAMVLGPEGAAATRTNLLASAPRFGLSTAEAAGLVDAVESTVRDAWRRCLEARGLTDAQLERLAPRFVPKGFG